MIMMSICCEYIDLWAPVALTHSRHAACGNAEGMLHFSDVSNVMHPQILFYGFYDKWTLSYTFTLFHANINKTKQKARHTWNDYGIFWAQSSRPRGSNATNVRGTRGEDLQIKCKSALRTAANSQSAVTFSTSCYVSLLCLTLFNQVSKFPRGHLQTGAVRILSLLTLVYSRQSLSWPEKIEINGGRQIESEYGWSTNQTLHVRRCADCRGLSGLHCCSWELELVVFRPWESHRFKWNGRWVSCSSTWGYSPARTMKDCFQMFSASANSETFFTLW